MPLIRPLRSAARETWNARELLWQLTRRDIVIRYKQSVMGLAWALLLPLLIVGSGVLVQLAIATVSGHPVERGALGGVVSKSVPWAFFSGAVGFGTGSLLANSVLISRIYFPREVLPTSAVLTQAFDSGIGALALAAALPFLGAVLSPALLWTPLLVLLLVSFTLAATLFLSCANLFFRDVKYLTQVVLTFGIFVTPVFFEPAMLGPRVGRLIMLNPLSPILEGFRLSIMQGHSLAVADGALWRPAWLLYSALWSVGGLFVAVRYFRASTAKFAEYA